MNIFYFTIDPILMNFSRTSEIPRKIEIKYKDMVYYLRNSSIKRAQRNSTKIWIIESARQRQIKCKLGPVSVQVVLLGPIPVQLSYYV